MWQEDSFNWKHLYKFIEQKKNEVGQKHLVQRPWCTKRSLGQRVVHHRISRYVIVINKNYQTKEHFQLIHKKREYWYQK